MQIIYLLSTVPETFMRKMSPKNLSITVKSVNGELIEVQYPPAAFSVAVVT